MSVALSAFHLEAEIMERDQAVDRWSALLHNVSLAIGIGGDESDDGSDVEVQPVKLAPAGPVSIDQLRVIERQVGIYCSKFGYEDERLDLVQDIVVAMLRTEYVTRFDEARSSLAVYVSRFVHNHFCKLYRQRKNAPRAVSLEADESESVYLSVHLGEAIDPSDVSSIVSLERVALSLEAERVCYSGVGYRAGEFIGMVYIGEDPEPGQFFLWRSASNVFRLTALGFFQEEIARAFRVSKGWISQQVKSLRSSPAVRNWVEGRR